MAGSYEHTMDENGRIIIPSKIRDAIGTHFYLCVDMSNTTQLEGMDEEDYFRKGEVISELYADDPEKVQFFFKYSSPITVDKQGRTVIPDNLRKKTGLGSDIVIIGMLKKFIIKNNVEQKDPDSEELREFNRKVSKIVNERRAQEKSAAQGG